MNDRASLNAAQVSEAIAALRDAGTALNCGNLSIEEQIRLGSRCYMAAAVLGLALKGVCVEVTA